MKLTTSDTKHSTKTKSNSNIHKKTTCTQIKNSNRHETNQITTDTKKHKQQHTQELIRQQQAQKSKDQHTNMKLTTADTKNVQRQNQTTADTRKT